MPCSTIDTSIATVSCIIFDGTRATGGTTRDDPPQWPYQSNRSKIAAFLRVFQSSFRRSTSFRSLLLQSAAELAEQQFGNRQQVLRVERPENDDLIEAIQKFRVKNHF